MRGELWNGPVCRNLRKGKGELSQGADPSSTAPWLWEEMNLTREERSQETEFQRQMSKMQK